MPQNPPRAFGCPVELSLEVLNGKWKPIILAHLKEGPLRYGELRARIPRLSDKMLSARLLELESQGLVYRLKKGKRGAPSTYYLTARGLTLKPVLQALYDWGVNVAHELNARFEPFPK